MGYNAPLAGFGSVELMVGDMIDSEDAQLMGAAAFMRAEGLDDALAAHDWPAFALGYNGPAYRKNQYDVRLDAAYRSFSGGAMPDLDVRRAQMLLMFLDIDPGAIDGIAGKRTRSALARFRQQEGVMPSEDVDAAVLALLAARVLTRSS
jgi:N-acetylmuramidase